MPKGSKAKSTLGGRPSSWNARFYRRGNNDAAAQVVSPYAVLEKVEEEPSKQNEETNNGETTSNGEQTKTNGQGLMHANDASPPSIRTTTSGSQEDNNEGSSEDEAPWNLAGPRVKANNHNLYPLQPPEPTAPPGLILGQNWRDRNGGAQTNQSNYRRPREHQVQSTKGTYRQLTRVHEGIHISELEVGSIIYFEIVVKWIGTDPDPKKNPRVFQTSDGQWWYFKGRFWHVNSVHDQHVNCSPIYTYQGKGIKDKSEAIKREHLGILPKHIKKEEYKQQNAYEPVAMKRMKDPREKLSEKSCIHFTKEYSATFDTLMRIVGYCSDGARVAPMRAQFKCI